MSAPDDEAQKQLHRQSIGNAALLFGGGDDDQSSLFAAAPSSADAGDDFFSGTGHPQGKQQQEAKSADQPQAPVADSGPDPSSTDSGKAAEAQHGYAATLFGGGDDVQSSLFEAEPSSTHAGDDFFSGAGYSGYEGGYGAGHEGSYQEDHQGGYAAEQQHSANNAYAAPHTSAAASAPYSANEHGGQVAETQHYYQQETSQAGYEYENAYQSHQGYDQPGDAYHPYAPPHPQSSSSMDRDATQTGPGQGYGADAYQNSYTSPGGTEQRLGSDSNGAYDPYGPPHSHHASTSSNTSAPQTASTWGYENQAANAETPTQYGYDSHYSSQSSYGAYAPQPLEATQGSGGTYDPYGPPNGAPVESNWDYQNQAAYAETPAQHGYDSHYPSQSSYDAYAPQQQEARQDGGGSYDPYGPPQGTGSSQHTDQAEASWGYEGQTADTETLTQHGYDSHYPSQSSYGTYAPQPHEATQDSGESQDPYGPSKRNEPAQNEAESYDPYGPPKRAESTQVQAGPGWNYGTDEAGEAQHDTYGETNEADDSQGKGQEAALVSNSQEHGQDESGQDKSETYGTYRAPSTPADAEPGHEPSTEEPASRSLSQDLFPTSSSTELDSGDDRVQQAEAKDAHDHHAPVATSDLHSAHVEGERESESQQDYDPEASQVDDETAYQSHQYLGHSSEVDDPEAAPATQDPTSMERDAAQTETERGFGTDAYDTIYASPPSSDQKLSSNSQEAYDSYGPPPPRNASTDSNTIAAPLASVWGYGSEAADAETPTQHGYDAQYPSQSLYNAYAPEPQEARQDSGGSHDPYGPPKRADSTQNGGGSYDPYGPPKRAVSVRDEADSYDPYGPPQRADAHTAEDDAASYDPYGPPKRAVSAQDEAEPFDPYGPPKRADTAEDGAASYDPYGAPKRADSTQNQEGAGWNYGTNEAKVAQNGNSREIYPADGHQQQQQDEDPYSDPQQHQQDDFGRRGSETYDPYGPPLTPSRAGPGYGPSAGGPVSRSFSQDLLSTSSSAMLLPDVAEERRRVRIPCVTFGVDGKVVTYFPQSSTSLGTDSIAPSYGGAGMFDSTSSSSDFPTKVTVRSLRSLVSSNSYASVFDPLAFPGPVFEGAAGSGGLGALGGATLSRAGAGGTAKKAAVVAYLRDRASEVEQGVKYLSLNAGPAGALGEERENSKNGAATTVEGQRSTDKAILLRLLALIVEHDGKVVDNSKFDAAARSLLADRSADVTTPSANAYSSGAPLSPTQDEPVATYSLTPSLLSNLQDKLVQGQRHEAVEYALEQRMWAHAMVIASGLDKETWCKTVAEFVSFELERETEGKTHDTKALRTAYALFSGQNATRVYDSFRPKVSLSSSSVLSGSNPAAGWQESAAAVISNRSAGDSSVLTAMGDGLLLSESIEAAHVCYLLSPQAANFGGVDSPGVRAVLVGGHNPRASNLYLHDLDSILLTEIYEYAQSLLPTVKGQEAFNGLPHLQAFRLVHAMALAELGETARAQKYCEAIAATFKSGKPSPYFHPILLSQLKEFTTRLMGGSAGAGASASSGNWMTKKMQKPTLDGVWGALEGRFTKFIAGEDGAQGSAQSSQPVSKAGSTQGIVGPFSHFSSITADGAEPTMSSQPASRAGSAMDFRPRRAESPAVRATSALSVRGGMQPLTPFAGAGPQPTTPTSGRDPYSNWPGSATQSGFATNAASPYGNFISEADETSTTNQGGLRGVNPQITGSFASSQSSDAGYEGPYRSYGETSDAPWWGQDSTSSNVTAGATVTDEADTSTRTQAPGEEPYYGYQPHGAAAPQFFSSVDPPAGEASDSFVSPMDAFSRPASREPSYGAPAPVPTSRYDDVDEEDDLGLGNSANKKAKPRTDDDKAGGNAPAPAAAPSPAKDEAKLKAEADQAKKPELRTVSSTSSWLGRFWGRGGGDAEAKSKQAHLGAKENTFYYDKDLKRWVNKAAGDTGAAATPPPPPPQRAQTASPSVQNGRIGAPPPRSSLDHTMSASSSSGYLRTTSTPEVIAEEDTPVSPTRGNFPGPTRTRSNLGDLSMPPASQPPMRPASAVASGLGGPPPMGSSAPPSMMGSPSLGGTPPPPGGPPRAGAAAKKKPLKARYVVVD